MMERMTRGLWWLTLANMAPSTSCRGKPVSVRPARSLLQHLWRRKNQQHQRQKWTGALIAGVLNAGLPAVGRRR